jgi:monoterpene epsilon-lactone hydrolase
VDVVPSPESLAVRELLKQQREAAKQGPTLSIEEQRQQFEAMSTMVPVDPRVSVERGEIAGRPAEWLTPPNPAPGVFLYLHGGAYYMGSAATHRELAGRLALATGLKLLVPEYRLAPEHPFPAALEDAVAAYQALLQKGFLPTEVVVGGDSAGGGLTAATLVALRDRGVALPAGGVLLSPWTDLAGTGPSMETRAPFDPMLDPEGIRAGAKPYVNGYDPKTPLISPLYADLHGLPPLLIFVGEDECLLDDAARLAKRAHDAGVEVQYRAWEGMWHVFPMAAAQVPEGREAIEDIGRWVKARVA